MAFVLRRGKFECCISILYIIIPYGMFSEDFGSLSAHLLAHLATNLE